MIRSTERRIKFGRLKSSSSICILNQTPLFIFFISAFWMFLRLYVAFMTTIIEYTDVQGPHEQKK